MIERSPHADAASTRVARHYGCLLALLSVSGTIAAGVIWATVGLGAAALAYAAMIALLYVVTYRLVTRGRLRMPPRAASMHPGQNARQIRR